MSIRNMILVALLSGAVTATATLAAVRHGAVMTKAAPADSQPVQSSQLETTKRELQHSIEQFRRGMVEADAGTIRRYSSPKLSFGHSNGEVQTLDEFVNTLKSQTEIFKRVELINRNLRVAGRIAIERHHFSADIIYKGTLKNFELEIVEVWEKSDHWRLLVRQAFKI